jgi:3-hydroxyisobutyrate dehydrogenase-like beta-hydroxyacid dehydrogenase
LLALVGGRPEVVERGRPIYRCFCSDYAHLGEVGHGQVGKTMNNLLLWINAVGLIEAGRLAETTGIDLVKLRAALLISSGASNALKEWDGVSSKNSILRDKRACIPAYSVAYPQSPSSTSRCPAPLPTSPGPI